MVHFIYGTAKSGKTEYILNLLKDKALKNIETTLFVPEQFSFETERELIERIGEEKASNVSLYSFGWLCDELKREYGGAAKKYVDDGIRHLLMLKTLKSLKGELKLFKSEPDSLAETLINTVKDFKLSGTDSKELLDISNNLSPSVLKDKLSDVSLVMSTYDALLASKYIDPIDDLAFAYEVIKNNDYFKDKTIVFDGFSSFTGQQIKFIKRIIIDAKDVYFSLCTDGKIDDPFSVFAPANKTARMITDFSLKEAKKKISPPVILEKKLYDSEDLICVGDFFENSKNRNTKIENISAFSFSGKYDECEFAANMIHKIARSDGYNRRYRDFAFICRNPENYAGFIKNIFEKYNVPIYVNENRCLSEALLSIYLLLLLSSAKSFKSEEILRLIKTGLTDVSEKELFELDNYIYMWNIDREQWEAEWTFNPFGLKELSEERKAEAEDRLKALNETRSKILELLNPLHFLKKASGLDFSHKIFESIEKNGISEKLSTFVDSLKSRGEHSEADFQVASWDAVIEVLDTIVDAFGDDDLSFSEYYSILQKSLSIKSVGGIPQGLDEVIFTTPEKLRTYDIKIAFIAGFNYGVFPSISSNKGLFSTSERALLGTYLEYFSDRSIDNALEENFLVYKALTCPKAKLYLMNYLSEYSGSAYQISPVYSSLCSYLGIEPQFIDMNKFSLDSIETKTQAISVAANNIKKDFPAAKEIFGRLCADPGLRPKIASLLRAATAKKAKISPKNAENIFKTYLDVSPTMIESYYKCPYAFFCKYGLNINKREKIDFLVMQRGTIAHYVLEKILNHYFFDFPDAPIEECKDMIDKLILEYIELAVGSYNALDAYSKYILSRINDMLYELVDYVISEIRASGFKPKAFEFEIKSNTDVPPLEIETEKGTVALSGKIDRVDAAIIDGKEYIRIIDYKTGKKDFALSDILSGLNLQMLVYLAAICQSPIKKFYPAGVVYQPLNHVKREGVNAVIKDNSPKAKGLLTDDMNVLEVMDPTAQYMPFKLTKHNELYKTSPCVSSEDFEMIFEYIKKKVADMHKSLLNGEINTNPCANDNNYKTCTYCDYKEICRFKVEDKSIPSYSISETLDIIWGEES